MDWDELEGLARLSGPQAVLQRIEEATVEIQSVYGLSERFDIMDRLMADLAVTAPKQSIGYRSTEYAATESDGVIIDPAFVFYEMGLAAELFTNSSNGRTDAVYKQGAITIKVPCTYEGDPELDGVPVEVELHMKSIMGGFNNKNIACTFWRKI